MSKFNEFELEQNLAALAERADSSIEFLDAFPLEILSAYQVPAAQIARIEKGRGPSMLARDLTIPKQMIYHPAQPGKVHDVIAQLKAQRKPGKIPGKTEPRFLVSTDGHDIAPSTRMGYLRRVSDSERKYIEIEPATYRRNH